MEAFYIMVIEQKEWKMRYFGITAENNGLDACHTNNRSL